MDRISQFQSIDRVHPQPRQPPDRKAKKDGETREFSLEEDAPSTEPNTEVRPAPTHENGVGERVDITA